MQKYIDAAFSSRPVMPLSGAKVTVTTANGDLATLYSDNAGTLMGNPIYTDSAGNYSFYAADGRYTITISKTGFQTQTITDVLLEDPSDQVADLEALQLADYAALRAYAGPRKSVYVIAPGIAGMFVRDYSDTASADNGGTVIVGSNGNRWKRAYDGAANIKWFGAVGDGTTDNTATFAAAFAACKRIVIPGQSGEVYLTSKYPRADNIEVTGLGRPTISLFKNDTPVMVQFGNNSLHENIKFSSTETNLSLQRAGLEQVANVVIRRCGFYGFRHVDAQPNAWGVYIKNATDCVLDRCDFGDNSQSDIALVDNVHNITVIHPSNTVDAGGVYLNVEPNADNGVDGLTVIGGKFRKVTLLENSYTGYASRHISFIGATIASLVYDGSGATFDDSCSIGSIANQTNAYAFGGDLNVSLGLSRNLVDDPYLVDLASSNPAGQWMAEFISSAWAADRVKDTTGTYVRLNKNNITQAHWIKSKKIAISGTLPLLFLQVARSVIPAGASWVGQRVVLRYYSAADASLGTTIVPTCRGLAGTTTPMLPHFAVVNPPANTAYVIIQLGGVANQSSISDHVAAVGLWEISNTTTTLSNTRAVVTAMIQHGVITTRAEQAPNGAGFVGGFVGERVRKITPVVGQPAEWECTADGSTNWVPIGVVGASQVATQADSSAADVASLKTDFNALLAKLRTAKVIAP